MAPVRPSPRACAARICPRSAPCFCPATLASGAPAAAPPLPPPPPRPRPRLPADRPRHLQVRRPPNPRELSNSPPRLAVFSAPFRPILGGIRRRLFCALRWGRTCGARAVLAGGLPSPSAGDLPSPSAAGGDLCLFPHAVAVAGCVCICIYIYVCVWGGGGGMEVGRMGEASNWCGGARSFTRWPLVHLFASENTVR